MSFIVNVPAFQCQRCGHTWLPKEFADRDNKNGPKVCPVCKSKLWREPSQSKRRGTAKCVSDRLAEAPATYKN